MAPGTPLLGSARPALRFVRSSRSAARVPRFVTGSSGATTSSGRTYEGALLALAAARAPTAGGRAPGLHLLDRLRR